MNISPRPISWNLLRTFCIVSQYTSLAEAAQYLQMTLSNLTHRINDLESRLGYCVFKRCQKRGIELLEKGQELQDLILPFYQSLANYEAHCQTRKPIFTVNARSSLPSQGLQGEMT